jgi:hypothetical protein
MEKREGGNHPKPMVPALLFLEAVKGKGASSPFSAVQRQNLFNSSGISILGAIFSTTF